MNGGIGRRCGLDLVLRCRLAAVAPIRRLAWEPPYVPGAALEKTKKKKKKKKKKGKKERIISPSQLYVEHKNIFWREGVL